MTDLQTKDKVDKILSELYLCNSKEKVEKLFDKYDVADKQERIDYMFRCSEVSESYYPAQYEKLPIEEKYDFELAIFVAGAWRLIIE